jgi:hypothetical protein
MARHQSFVKSIIALIGSQFHQYCKSCSSAMHVEIEGLGGSHYSDGVVVEDRGNIFGGKFVRGVADEKTCLADSTVANDDAPVGKSC